VDADKDCFVLLADLWLCPHVQGGTIFTKIDIRIGHVIKDARIGFSDAVRLDKAIREMSVVGGYV
jgi:hypothetical protein